MVVAGSAPSHRSRARQRRDPRSRARTFAAGSRCNVAQARRERRRHGHDLRGPGRGARRARTGLRPHAHPLDGARVTRGAARRARARPTSTRPRSKGIEISRGPGSVAYGSDAFGGVIQLRTRRAEPGSRPSAAASPAPWARARPSSARPWSCSRGFDRGGVLVQGHWRNFEDWDSPEGDGPQLRARRTAGCLARLDHLLGGGLLQRRLAERLRPRHRAAAQQLRRRALLLPDRGLAPPDPRAGSAAPLAGLDRVGATRVRGHATRWSPTRTASPPPARPRSVERADVSAERLPRARRSRRSRSAARGSTAALDVNGRFDLRGPRHRARSTTPAGALGRHHRQPLDETPAAPTPGLYLQAEVPAGDVLLFSAGGRGGPRVARATTAATSATVRESNGALSGFAAATVGPLLRLLGHRAGRAGVPRPDAVRPLLPRPDRPRLHHRQPRPGAGDEPQFDARRPLRRSPLARRRLRVPLPHHAPRRAIPDGDGLLLLPQPRPGAHPRNRRRAAGELALAARRRADRARPRRAGARRFGGARQHSRPHHDRSPAPRLRPWLRLDTHGALRTSSTIPGRPSRRGRGTALLDAGVGARFGPRVEVDLARPQPPRRGVPGEPGRAGDAGPRADRDRDPHPALLTAVRPRSARP